MITAEMVRELIDYNPKTGVFTWKSGRRKGKKASNKGTFANQIKIDNVKTTCKRIAWLIMVGVLPDGGHRLMSRDGDPFNDKWGNITMQYSGMRDLMFVDGAKYKGCLNDTPRKNNTTGIRGVSLHKPTGKYRAYIHMNGKIFNLGYYKTIEEAGVAVTTARNRVSAI